MTTEEALGEYLIAQGVANENDDPRALYADRWFYTRFRSRQLPFFPKLGFRRGLPAHDVHHMLNRYPTDWVGECETAVWELASGGCSRHLLYWIDRLVFLAISPVVAPVRCLQAWRRGWGQKNLYRFDPDQLLAMDLAETRRHVASRT